MEYHQNQTIHQLHNTVIYIYLAFNKMPPKYNNMPFHHFFLILCAKHVSKYKSGIFIPSDLLTISGYSMEYFKMWSNSLINKGFLVSLGSYRYEISPFGLLAVRAFNRAYYRFIKAVLLPINEHKHIDPM